MDSRQDELFHRRALPHMDGQGVPVTFVERDERCQRCRSTPETPSLRCASSQISEKPLDYVLSLIVVVPPFALTEAMPTSRLCSDAYIWLVPITW